MSSIFIYLLKGAIMTHISIQQLGYNFPNGTNLFNNLSFIINQGEKIALIGDNGVGKSTLFKIITGELKETSGHTKIEGNIAIVPQIFSLQGTISECLEIKRIIDAIASVESGNTSEDTFDIIGNNWDIEDQAKNQLNLFKMGYLDLNQDSSTLSGGEKIKLLLIKALLAGADFILMDEPTNNLDITTKQQLLEIVKSIKCGVFIVSHDRELLNNMDKITEMRKDKIRVFGGNYDFYKAIKEKEQQDLEKEYSVLKKEQKAKKQEIQDRQKDTSKSIKRGVKKLENKKIDKNQMNKNQMKQVIASSNQKKDNLATEKMQENSKDMYQIKHQLKENKINIPMPQKPFLRNAILSIKNASFSYDNKRVLLDDLSCHLSGGEKLQIKGNNGSGKSTLIKLILGELKTIKGSVELKGKAIFIDQSLSILDKEKSLLDNFLSLNPGAKINDAHKILASFLFKKEQVHKLAEVLSGGELLKACLACILGTEEQPDLIILDEPTNNLDIKSIDILENVLAQYQGSLIIVSHDDKFAKNIGIDKTIEL
jgi:ATPase subunit of ABC transporter with duplicated ATPase domains